MPRSVSSLPTIPDYQAFAAHTDTGQNPKLTSAKSPGSGHDLKVAEQYCRPASPLGHRPRASTLHQSMESLSEGLQKLHLYTSIREMLQDARSYLVEQLAARDKSKPTFILVFDLHGHAPEMGLMALVLGTIPKGPQNPSLLLEQTRKDYLGGFGVADDVGRIFKRKVNGGPDWDDKGKEVEEMMKQGLSVNQAMNLCTWGVANALRVEVAPFDLNKGKKDNRGEEIGFMEVREDAMKTVMEERSVHPQSMTVGHVGILHAKPLIEHLMSLEDRPNIIAMGTLPEHMATLERSFDTSKVHDIRRTSFVLGTEFIKKFRITDALSNQFPDPMAEALRHPPVE